MAFSTTDKSATFHVKTVKKKRDQRRPDERKFSVHGRPGKRTPQLEKDLLAAVETGAPFRIVCLACGISDDTFANWRRKDPEFADRVNKAAGKTALRLLKKIEANADENFSAAAWLLERRFPESFSRPEIQLGLTVNNQVTNNTLVITAEVAENLHRRNSLINKELDEISRNHESRQKQLNGSNGGSVREVEVESSLAPKTDAIQLPPVARRTASWWKMLSSGSGERGIALEAAKYAFKTVVTDCVGAARASGARVQWDKDGALALSDLWNAISELCGEAGWQRLVERGANRPPDGAGRSTDHGQSAKAL